MDLVERSARFGRCFGVEGILAELDVDLSPVVKATQAYLMACKKFDENVYQLPNFTKNGDLRPRVEVLPEFNQVEVEARRLFASVLKGDLDLVQRVISVRVKGGKEEGGYSSSHIHSDTWAGEPSGGVVMIPIEGDFEEGGVEFYRPTKGSPKDFSRFHESYELVPDFGPELIGKMKSDRLYILDAYCLHKTLRGGYRVSVDFRFSYFDKLRSDFPGIGKRLANYCPYRKWALTETNKSMRG